MNADSDFDPEAFRKFEHEGWDQVSSGYHHHWEHLTTQIVPSILEAASVSANASLLDVACGPGYVSALASEKGARAIGVDLSEEMIKLATKIHENLSFKIADAENLPFEDASFDVVTINFGVLHFPNANRSLAEAYRVLVPSGRLVFTAWSGPENSAIGMAMDAVSKFGTMDVKLPAGPPIFRFASHAECIRTATDIGFTECQCEDHLLQWTLPSPDALMDSFREATARTSGLLSAQMAKNIPAIKAAMVASCEPFTTDGKATVPMPAVLTVATKSS